MQSSMVFEVPGMSCEHCKAAVTEELLAVDGVELVRVDLDSKRVEVDGTALVDAVLRRAISDAGYDVA
jgi:copper chaperone CopZ